MPRYPTKIDLWIAALVIAVLIALLGLAVFGFLMEDAVLLASGLLGAISVVAVIRLFALPMSYEIADSAILIESGIQHLVIPFDHIDEVQKTRAPWSSPAWSFDRLRIDYRTPGEKPRWVLISPTDETRFIDDLAARTRTTLRREGDSLRRG
jgi:PH (Pleckstrin Homology) domain-containing protein